MIGWGARVTDEDRVRFLDYLSGNFSPRPPPPTEASAAGKRDFQTILDLQKNMTPARMADIQRDLDQSVYTVAGPVLGPKFTKENFPLAGDFFAKVVKDSGIPEKREALYERGWDSASIASPAARPISPIGKAAISPRRLPSIR
jgi:hypothetical protein